MNAPRGFRWGQNLKIMKPSRDFAPTSNLVVYSLNKTSNPCVLVFFPHFICVNICIFLEVWQFAYMRQGSRSILVQVMAWHSSGWFRSYRWSFLQWVVNTVGTTAPVSGKIHWKLCVNQSHGFWLQSGTKCAYSMGFTIYVSCRWNQPRRSRIWYPAGKCTIYVHRTSAMLIQWCGRKQAVIYHLEWYWSAYTPMWYQSTHTIIQRPLFLYSIYWGPSTSK